MPGTEVLVADGTTKPIEDIEIGDWVWATDPETGETGARRAVDTIIGVSTDLRGVQAAVLLLV